MEQHIADKILAHCAANKDNAVVIATYLKAYRIQQKNIDAFTKRGYSLITKSGTERGFYMQCGKRKDYFDPHSCSIRFGCYR
jgi:hypothetical protein